jgi:hypothetical protein
MFIEDFDRTHKNGCLRFIEFWKKVSNEKGCIKIIENADDLKIYALEYHNDEDKEYIVLVDGGVSFFFPIYPDTDGEININFSEDIVESNLASLFKLLNNKKNFHTV